MDDIGTLKWIWDEFFDRVRERTFDANVADSVLNKIRQINCEKLFLEKELVSLLWMTPLFMEWNRERCVENGADRSKYNEFSDKLTGIVIEKLGAPS